MPVQLDRRVSVDDPLVVRRQLHFELLHAAESMRKRLRSRETGDSVGLSSASSVAYQPPDGTGGLITRSGRHWSSCRLGD